MPRVHKHTARQDIYSQGVKIEDAKTKSGFRRDRSKPADEADTLLVAKGQEYYAWKFRYGGQQISLTPPTRRQLTQNEHQLRIYDFEDMLKDISGSSAEDLQSEVENLISELESYRDELQERFDNIPEQLQEGEAGTILQERIGALDNAISELEGVDLEYDEPSNDEIIEELRSENDGVEPFNQEVSDRKAEKLQDWIEEKLDEIKSISFE